MLKKVFYITFALFFTLTATGVTIQENFCNNKLLSIYFDKTSGKCCENPCSDCHIKVVTFKITDTFFSTSKKNSNNTKAFIKCPFSTCETKYFSHGGNGQKIHNPFNLSSTPKSALNRAQLQVFLC
jgi:hypothetical protein